MPDVCVCQIVVKVIFSSKRLYGGLRRCVEKNLPFLIGIF
jgi:hypothetical protein